MYKPEHFPLEELFPQKFHHRWHKKLNLWHLWDDRALWTFDQIRNLYGTIIINDWVYGGDFQFSGYRPFGVEVGAEWSQHKFGRAGDLHPEDYTAEEIRKDIIENPYQEEFQYITCVETDISWLHIDFRNHDKENDGLLMIKP